MGSHAYTIFEERHVETRTGNQARMRELWRAVLRPGAVADHLPRLALAVLATAGIAATASAQTQPTKGEQALKYRKSLYQVIAWNVGPMNAMAQGKAAYDAAEFARRAEAVAFLAPMLPEGYAEESRGVEGSASALRSASRCRK